MLAFGVPEEGLIVSLCLPVRSGVRYPNHKSSIAMNKLASKSTLSFGPPIAVLLVVAASGLPAVGAEP